MNCVHVNAGLLTTADVVLDYIPFASTVTNLVDLFQKLVVVSSLKKEEITANRYYAHLNDKSKFRCVLLLVPVLGNVAVIIYDCISKYRTNVASKTPIKEDFTKTETIENQRKAHKNAKEFLTSELKKIGGEARFISHSKRNVPSLKDVEINTDKLKRANVVKFQYTQGVLEDIKRDGKRTTDNAIVYGVASQFNGCEAPDKYTVKPGEAVRTYKSDRTQGPQAQLAFSPEQVELINWAGNLGFNGLCPALSQETKAEIAHGYFTPNEDKADLVVQQLRDSGHLVEYSCIANKPLEGQKPVHIALVAAPAFGRYAGEETVSGEKQEEIQFLCALNGYRAQLEECVRLARETGKAVIFKPAAVGLGVFSNDPKIVAKALYQALLEYQDELETSNSQVIFQVFKSAYGSPDPKAFEVAAELGLSELV